VAHFRIPKVQSNSTLTVLRSIILGILLIGISVVVYKLFVAKKEDPLRSAVAPVKPVKSIMVKKGELNLSLDLTGRLIASNRIELFSEVQGVMSSGSVSFKGGNAFRKGQLLLSIDDAEARAALIAQRSTYITTVSQIMPDIQIDYPGVSAKWKTYLSELDPLKEISKMPEIESDKLRLFLTSRGLISAFYSLRSAEVRNKKYQIYAPFDGVLTDALVTEGSLIRPGQALGSFIHPNEYELEASIPAKDVGLVQVGTKAEFHSAEMPGTWEAKLVRINSKVDANSQSVRLFFSLQASELKEGQYLNGKLPGILLSNHFAIARRNLINDRFLFAIRDSTLFRLEPNIEAFTEEWAIFSDVQDDELLLNELVSGAFEGMKVAPQMSDKQ
jgi:membrane fusion protein, multidrug efflux system